MKAKEYYEKFKVGLISTEADSYLSAARGLLSEMLDECKAAIEARHVQFDRGLFPILREQNDKYKATVRMFEQEYGASPIRLDGFELILEDYFPGVVERMRPRAPRTKLDTHTRGS